MNDDDIEVKFTVEPPQPPKKKWAGKGGARKGAGRKPGSKSIVTVKGLLEELTAKTGQTYEEVLIEDFLDARDKHDQSLMVKYHHLILNKVMNSLNKIEVVDHGASVEAKQAAFTAALEKILTSKE